MPSRVELLETTAVVISMATAVGLIVHCLADKVRFAKLGVPMSWWKDHGPKIVNGVTTAVGVLSGVDPSLLPPSWLPYVIGVNAILNVVHNVQHNAVAPMSGPGTLPPPAVK